MKASFLFQLTFRRNQPRKIRQIPKSEMSLQFYLINFNNIQRHSQMMKTIEGYTYKISESIGKGYSSTVHKGLNDKTGEQVSIKVIEMAKLQDPINQMLLQHEITALKKLSFSSGVLHLYDVYATKNNTYIVTELCDGDLATLLKKRKNIPYHESVQIVRQIINGYLDVNNSGYLHRDIKPANIFYKGTSYKIGDFGFAIPKKQLEQHKNYNVGSPVYMPPQALKDNIYSVSCDTWAIGIIFYQIIRGVVPWRAISEQKLLQKILTEPLDQLTMGLPEVAKNFLARVLHLDPKMRMTIQQMVNWPSKLAAVEIVGLPSCSPLRELKDQSNQLLPPVAEIPKMVQTPKQLPSNHFRFIPQPPPTQKHINSNPNFQLFTNPSTTLQTNTQNSGEITNQNTNFFPKPVKNTVAPFSSVPATTTICPSSTVLLTQCDDGLIGQTAKNATSLVQYLHFLHRVHKFITPPYVVAQLPDLANALTAQLFFEMDLLNEYIKNPNLCSLEKWQSFLVSQKGATFKTSLTQCRAKYRMFHVVNDGLAKQLSEQIIKEAIVKILQKVEESSGQGNEKSIIALDYLTTLYQLWHIKNKYPLKDFLKMSKISIIMEGNPYNATPGHLTQIKRKLLLIDILENK